MTMGRLLAGIGLIVGPPVVLVYGVRLAVQSFGGDFVVSMLISAIIVFYVTTLMRAERDDHST